MVTLPLAALRSGPTKQFARWVAIGLLVSACQETGPTNPNASVVGPRFDVGTPVTTVTITDLGTLPGGTQSNAQWINDAGQAVGAGNTAGGTQHAILWQNGVATDLGTLPGGTSSSASMINNLGQIVGFSSVAGLTHAVMWDHGAIIDLAAPPRGYNSIYATAINDAGEVVGYALDTSVAPPGVPGIGTRVFHAIRWRSGVMTDLGLLNGRALGINNAGVIVGLYSGGPSGAFLWQQGVVTDVPTLGGRSTIVQNGINDSGWVTGASFTATSAPLYHAFLWKPSTGMIDLGLLPNGVRAFGEGLNNAGQVVGDATPAGGLAQPTLFQEPAVVDLGSLASVINPGSGGGVAWSVNNKGQAVGSSSTASRASHATLWTIAQPQSITFTSTAPSPAIVGGTYAITATATSGLPVAFGTTTPSICAAAGATVTFIATGTCVVTADQAGNSAYLAAPEQTQSIPVITVAQAIQNLITTISAMGLPVGVTTSLIASLKNVNTSNVAASCGKLGAFVNQVNAKVQAGQLSVVSGGQLLQARDAIAAALGCE